MPKCNLCVCVCVYASESERGREVREGHTNDARFRRVCNKNKFSFRLQLHMYTSPE